MTKYFNVKLQQIVLSTSLIKRIKCHITMDATNGRLKKKILRLQQPNFD